MNIDRFPSKIGLSFAHAKFLPTYILGIFSGTFAVVVVDSDRSNRLDEPENAGLRGNYAKFGSPASAATELICVTDLARKLMFIKRSVAASLRGRTASRQAGRRGYDPPRLRFVAPDRNISVGKSRSRRCRVDSQARTNKPVVMEIEDLSPGKAGNPLDQLLRQDIDRLSNDELAERIERLEIEIARCRARMAAVVNHRANAEGLFKR